MVYLFRAIIRFDYQCDVMENTWSTSPTKWKSSVHKVGVVRLPVEYPFYPQSFVICGVYWYGPIGMVEIHFDHVISLFC